MLKFFDLEVFEDWWCCVISDEEPEYKSVPYKFNFTTEEEQNIKSKMRVYTSDNKEDVDKLKADIDKEVACGYNIKNYDLVILNGIFMRFTCHQLHVLSELIITDGATANKDVEHMRISQYMKRRYFGCQAIQDLMDDSVKSLKDKEASFGMDIRETTVPFDAVNLTQEQKDQIIFYCKHDVYALHVMYVCTSKPYIDTKLALCKTYDLPMKLGYESTNAVLSCKVLGAERQHGTTIVDPTIKIYQPKLNDYINQWVPEKIKEHLLTKQAALTEIMFDNTVSMGDGGLHSIYNVPKVGRTQGKLYVEATDEWGLYNIDVSSCYPSCMIFGGSMSRAATKHDRFTELYKRRLNLKLTPKSQWTDEDKQFVPAAKLVLNTTYGAMGNKYLPLYDDYMRSKTCRLGQLILLAVAHDITFHIPDLKIIQTNTDGILAYCRRDALNILKERVSNFEQLSGFVFEFEEDTKIWQINVNNYVAQSTDGSLKSKGEAFATDIWQKGTNKLRPLGVHAIAKAQIDYYVNDKNPIKYLLETENVNDLCLTCYKGPSYKYMVQETSSGDVELGKVARVMAIEDNTFGALKKVKYVDGNIRKDTCAECPEHALVMNDALYNYKIVGPRNNRVIQNIVTGKEYKIDYGYYVDKLANSLDLIWFEMKNEQLKQVNKFGLGG